MNSPLLPKLNTEQETASEQLKQHIIQKIEQQKGSIPFIDFMRLALYTPQLGYYTGGAHKIGQAGDFITAPTLTDLFGQTLATQLTFLLPQTAGNIYEFGAGTGHLAATLLNELSSNHTFSRYIIIELSAELAERQKQHIAKHAPHALHQVIWQNSLPEQFDGIIIGNELLDALPVERITLQNQGVFERVCVAHRHHEFQLIHQPLQSPTLLKKAQHYFAHLNQANSHFPYTSELHPEQFAFINTLAQKLTRGAMIFIDYGFDEHEYYHPQRQDGTLIGHHAHHTIHDPFFRLGLTDLTAHINFSDIAQAATIDNPLDFIGYTTQANFLLNLGILNQLTQRHPNPNSTDYIQAAHAVQVLIAPHEMGELFKVIAFGKHIDTDWQGFTKGDISYKL